MRRIGAGLLPSHVALALAIAAIPIRAQSAASDLLATPIVTADVALADLPRSRTAVSIPPVEARPATFGSRGAATTAEPLAQAAGDASAIPQCCSIEALGQCKAVSCTDPAQGGAEAAGTTRSAAADALASSGAKGAPAEPPPGNRLEIGLEERVRAEYWNNVHDFHDRAPDERHQFRFRTRLWGKLNLGSKAEVMVTLNNETRNITLPDTEFIWDEVIFETLYLDYHFDAAWSIKVGRQDIMKGEGFILFDGGPLDGSRTAYMNALDLVWAPGKSRLELIAISDPDHDIYLPRFNDKEKALIEWDEALVGFYFTGKELARTGLEAYALYKTEESDRNGPIVPSIPRDRRYATLGGRVVHEWEEGWSVTGELAGQSGREEPDIDVRAWGGYGYLTKVLGAAAKPSLSVGYIGMSGDDPHSETIEGWNPVIARWPKWSELYLYTLSTEQGVAYWSNISSWRAELVVKPLDTLNLRGTWYRLRAFEAPPSPGRVFGDGRDRGDLYQIRADWKPSQTLRGHLLYERMDPGDFYAGNDPAWFLRAEVIVTLRKPIRL